MARQSYDWEALQKQFIRDPRKPSVVEFIREHSLNAKTVANRASRDKWLELREAHWGEIEEKAGEKLADLQVTQIVRSTAQQLSEIQKMKEAALKVAGGVDGAHPFYENAGQAVTAYEKLTKLERLLTDQSTENVSVSDGRAFVMEVIQILREEVRDSATLERVANRIANLGGPVAGSVGGPTLN